MAKQTLFLEDLKVGDVFISETYELSTDKIKAFAHEFDPQVFHCDENLAEDTFLRV